MERNRSRGWCWTVNNPSEDEVLVPQSWDPKSYDYLVYQLEEGAEGTRHLQGYTYCKNPRDFEAFCSWFPRRPHVEKAKGTAKQNRTYCTKAEGRVEGPWEFGVMPEQGKRNDILAMKADLDNGATLRDISEDYTGLFLRYYKGIQLYQALHHVHSNEAKTVKCLWGPTGVGKTKYCWDTYPGAYWKARDPCRDIQYWDGYDGEDTIIIDEFYGWLPWDFLLRLCDRYPLRLGVRGSSVQCAAKTIVFTSNKHPREWYPKLGYAWDDTNPLKRRFGDNIVELLPATEPDRRSLNDILMGERSMDPVPREPGPTYSNGLPVRDWSQQWGEVGESEDSPITIG